MKRSKWNFLVDMILFGLVVALAFVGIAMAFFMAEGPVDDLGSKYLWGLHRHQWGDIHLVLSLVFVAFFLVHVVLHWTWIKGCARSMLRSTASLGLALVLPAVFVLAAWACADKDAAEYREYGTRSGRGRETRDLEPDRQRVAAAPGPEEAAAIPAPGKEAPRAVRVEVNGSMSLYAIEKQTGVPARRIASELGLPGGADLSRNLGRLRRQHGFAVEDVRKIVTRLSGGRVVAVDSDSAGAGRGGKGIGKGTGKGAGQGTGEGAGAGAGSRHRREIQGRMTLGDVGRSAGVPARAIADKLGLPPDAPLDVRLGWLKRRYGFAMQDVRAAVAALQER